MYNIGEYLKTATLIEVESREAMGQEAKGKPESGQTKIAVVTWGMARPQHSTPLLFTPTMQSTASQWENLCNRTSTVLRWTPNPKETTSWKNMSLVAPQYAKSLRM